MTGDEELTKQERCIIEYPNWDDIPPACCVYCDCKRECGKGEDGEPIWD